MAVFVDDTDTLPTFNSKQELVIHTYLYWSGPSTHAHYLTAGVLALDFLRLSWNQMATGSIFETANLQCHGVL